MKAKRGPLTYEEKIKAAYLCEVEGLYQHTVAMIFSVNQGAISEAVTTVRRALLEVTHEPSLDPIAKKVVAKRAKTETEAEMEF